MNVIFKKYDMKTKRLEILENSLLKKEALFDEKLQSHFDAVRQANGQPLNDKRNGQATLNKWERQNGSLRKLQGGIEATKAAIEREEETIKHVKNVTENLPKEITDMLDSGILIQWRKYPNIFFVKEVDKARIIWDAKKKIVAHKFVNAISGEQRKKFAEIFNTLYASFNNNKKGQ
jgi:hypothetical protein